MQFLRAYIENKIDIDESEWQKVCTLFSKTTYKKGVEFHSAGEICKKLYYLSSGTVRTYTINSNGKESTLGVHHHDNTEQLRLFMGDYISYLDDSASMIFCECLEDCVVYEAEYASLDVIYESDLKWMKLARKISEHLLVEIAKVMQSTRQFSAKERYIYIQNISPIYEKVLTDYQLASLLGITPQSFSRMKKSLLR